MRRMVLAVLLAVLVAAPASAATNGPIVLTYINGDQYGARESGLISMTPDGNTERSQVCTYPDYPDEARCSRPPSPIAWNADGSRFLTSEVSPGIYASAASWSPDNQRVVFVAHGDVFLEGANGEGLRRLTHTQGLSDRVYTTEQPGHFESVDWGREGRIAYVVQTAKGADVVTADSELGHRSVRAHVKGGSVQWSPDGRWLLVEGSDRIRLVTPRGKVASRSLHLRGEHLTWSPDGRFIAYITPAGDRLGIATAGGREIATRELYAPGNGAETDYSAPTWRPASGTALPAPPAAAPPARAHPRAPAGSVALTFVDAPIVQTFLSPADPAPGPVVLTGRAGFVAVDRHGRATTLVPRVDLTTNPDEYFAEPLDPVWSPDGTRLAYGIGGLRNGGLPGKVGVVNADGTGRAEFRVGANLVTSPSWSPDGTRIAFVSRSLGDVRAGPGGASVINADGTGLARLDTGPGVLGVKWSSRNQIAYYTDRGVSVARGLTYVRVLSGPWRLVDWSPDGRRLLVSRGDGTLYSADARGHHLRREPATRARVAADALGRKTAFDATGKRGVALPEAPGLDSRTYTSLVWQR